VSAEGIDITQKVVDWCIDELRYKANIFEGTGGVNVFDGDVVKSDTVISNSLKAALKEAVTVLEDIPLHEKDWHPGSDEKVLDLIHPSLFPLVYGRSRIPADSLVGLDDCIERCGEGKTKPVSSGEDLNRQGAYSKKNGFHATSIFPVMAPSKCLASAQNLEDNRDNTYCRITSYINNLHPQKHKNLYAIIEAIISCTIPLWNLTLTPMKARHLRY
jgi:hypothetical protein